MAIATASGRNDEAGRPAASPPPANETSAGPDRPSAAELGFPVTMLALAEAGQGCCGRDGPAPVPGRP